MNTQSADSANRNQPVRLPTLFDIFRGKVANGYRRIAQWRREGTLGNGQTGQVYRRRVARLETLEPRLLLSADLVHTVPESVALDATLRVADIDGAAMLQLLDNQSQGVLAERALDQDVDVTVRGNDQSDRLVIGFDRASIAHQIRLNFDGADGGVDELIGSDRPTTWRLDAQGVGTLDDGAFTGVEHVTGGAADDIFFVLDPLTTTAVEGGAGSDTLVGADGENQWIVSDADAGTLNAQSFAAIENLNGGAREDVFSVTESGEINGVISGGEGNDTLVGPDIPNTWEITTADGGTLNGHAFAGIENLTGGAGDDTFVFAGGSISGTIDGGSGVNTFDYASRSSGVTVDLAAGNATYAGVMAGINKFIGGAGSDTLVARNENNTWTVSGSDSGNVGEVAFAAIENITGGAQSDSFVFTEDGALSGIITGGPGNDFLSGADTVNTWSITNPDAGTMNAGAFAGIENLLGGSGSDMFMLMAAGGLSGTIAGGEGVDRVRGPERKTVWRFTGRGTGSVGGMRFSGIDAIEGAADEDTLVGPAEDTTWTVDGPNSGSLDDLSFSGMENLEGEVDNEDTFVVEASGSVSGLIDGGEGGFDSLVVNGSFDTIIFTPTGPHSGYVDRDGDVSEYAGLEPVAAGSATNIVFNGDGGVSNVDTWILEDSLTVGKLQLRSTSGQIETTEFAATASTITLNLANGDDSVTIASAGDSGFAGTIIVNGGADNDTLSAASATGGVTLNGGIGNDVITGGSGNDTLTGNSGNDTLTGGGGDDALNGGADDDTYKFGNLFGTDTIFDASGIDSVDFTAFTGSLTALSETGATAADGSTISYDPGTIENVTGAGNKVQLNALQKTAFLNGLQSVVTWANALNDYAKLGMPLPIIASNLKVGVGQALQIAEALDQIRLRVLNTIDWTATVTTQDILSAISGYAESAIEHLDRAILGDIKNAVITAADAMSFVVKLNGTGSEITITPVMTGVTSLVQLRDSINEAIGLQDLLANKLQAVISEGRLAIQSLDKAFTRLDVHGTGAAVSKLGFKSTAQSVLNSALEGLGNLSVAVGGATLGVNVGPGGIPELALHFGYTAGRTTNFSVDLGAEASNAGIAFDADATLSATASLSADLDLRLVLDASPSFLLDVNSLNANLAIGGAVNADISIGFLGAHVDGTISMSANPGLSFGSGTGITTAQLNTGVIDALAPTFTSTSSLDLDLGVSLSSALSGLTVVSGTANIFIDSSNLFTGDRDDVVVAFTGLDELLNFDNINAAGVAGLLGQLSGWLQSMGQSRLGDLSIPFANQTVGDIVNFKNVISDLLLFNDGDNTVLAKKKLVNDLTGAIASAGLSSQLRVEGDGTKLKLVSTDPAVTNFSVTASGANWLGFGSQSTTSGTLVASSNATIPSASPGTPGDAVLNVTIGGETKVVTVTQAALLDNLQVGYNIPKLLFGDNSPTFTNAQEFAARLSSVLTSISGLPVPLNYDAADHTLSFSIDLTTTLFDANLPLNFNLDLSPIANLNSTSQLHVNADGRLMLTIGFDLEDAQPSTLLTVTTALDSLNGGDGIEIKTAPSLMGATDAAETAWRLSSDATFKLSINGAAAKTIAVTRSATKGNTSIGQLISDINGALTAQSVTNVTAGFNTDALTGKFTLKLTGDGSVTHLVVQADAANSAVKELGFGVNKDVASNVLVADKTLRYSIGRFGSDLSFNVSIDGGLAQPVTVNGEDTTGTTGIDASTNNTIIDLVSDINKALRRAGLQTLDSDGDIAASSKLRVDFMGNRLLFTGGTGVSNFSISAAGTAASELGLFAGTKPSDNIDLVIKTHNGVSHSISLDGAVDIGDVIQKIADATGALGTIDKTPTLPDAIEGIITWGAVEVAYNEGRDGLRLIDHTVGVTPFAVMAANGSKAALELRVVGVDGLDDGGDFDGQIEGGQIASVTLADRFYVENAVVSADLAITTPGGINASAVFGDFVGISLSGNGTLNAGLQAGLKDPDTGQLGGRITLSQLVRGLSDIGSIVETPNFSGGGSFTLGVSTTPDISSLVSLGGTPQVNINLADFGNPFTASFVSKALSTFDFGAANFKITLHSLNADVNGLTASVNLSDLATNGNANLTDLAEDLSGAIQSAFEANPDVIALFGVGNIPQLVSVKAVSSVLGTAPDKLVLNALEDVVVGSSHIKIDQFTIGDADVAAKALFGLAPVEALNFIADLAPDIGFDFSDLDDLLKFDNVEFNFSAVLDALIKLSDFLGQFEEFGFLNDELPLIDMSINDVLDFADRLDAAINEALANPAGTIQSLGAKLDDALGLAPGTIVLSLDHWDHNTPADDSDDVDLLKFSINLSTGIDESANFVIPDIEIPVVGALDLGGAANLGVSGSIGLQLDFGVDLAHPQDVYVYDTTGISGSLAATGTDLEFRAALGGLGLFIKDGSANISGSIEAGVELDGTDRILIGDLLGSLGDSLDVNVSGGLDITLPTYGPTKNIFLGDFHLDLSDVDWDNPGADLLDSLTLPDFSSIDFSSLGLFDSIMLAVDGLDTFLGGLQDVMDGEVFGLKIPFIGDKLAAGGGFIQDFRNDFIDPLRSFLEAADDVRRDFINPSENFVSQLLFDLLGDPALTAKSWSLNLLKPLAADADHLDNPDSPLVPNGVEDFIKLDTDGETYVKWNFSIGGHYDVGTEVDLDIGIPGLGMEADGNIGIAFDWDLDLGFGLSTEEGFFLDIADDNELFANVDITLPSSFIGKLAFLQLRAEDAEVYSEHDGMTNVGFAFAVDIVNKDDPDDERLGMSEFGKMEFDAGVAAEAVAELQLFLEVNKDLIGAGAIAAGIPKIQSNFILDWGIGSYNVSNPENSTFVPVTGIGDAIQDGLHYVAFTDVSLDAGSFLSDVLGPIVKQVKEITDPIQPLIDIITAPIPVLSDLGPPITLLDIAASFGKVDPGMIYAIADIISLINRIPDPDATGTLLIPFGDFAIFDSRASTPGANQILSELWNPGLKRSGAGGLFDKLKGGLGSIDFDAILGDAADGTSKSTMQALRGNDAGGGFAFPIFDDPSQIFGLLMGEPAVLVTYDMAPLVFEFDWSTFFSIFGPLGVSINIGFSADIDFAFGYDTLGIQEFIDGNFQNPASLLDGFYVSDTDKPTGEFGTDVPEVVLTGELWAAAELNLGVARAGVGGGIFAEIDFDLFDPNHDGRVRISEIIKNVENQFKYGGDEAFLAPLAVFDVHGEITAKLFAFLKINLLFFKIDKTFNITPEIVLIDFDMDFKRVPVLANELDNGDLVLNMGRFAPDRVVDDLLDDVDMLVDQPEHFEVRFTSATHVQVRALNLGDDAMIWQDYDVTGNIIAYGDEGDDSIAFSGADSPVGYLIEGGVGDDVITLHAGAGGVALIRGDDGDDIITSGGGADTIYGGRGIDTIHAGGGNDIVFGDNGEITGGLDANAAALLKFDDQGDFLYGDDDNDVLIGGGGADTIEGGADADVILGDGGRVVLATGEVSDTNRGAAFGNDILFGNAGTDTIYGGRGIDIMDGGGDADTMYGEDGNDKIYGGGGGDTIFGQDGNDIIWGKRDPAAPTADDTGDLTADGGDTIEGNAGDDLIHGQGGNDTIHGNSGRDSIYGEDDDDTILGEGGADLIYGGHGADSIDGGADDDIIFGDAGAADFAASGTEPSPNAKVYGTNLPNGLPEHYEFGVTQSNGYTAILTDMIDTIYSFSGWDFIDGQAGADVYIVRLQGTDHKSFINVYDSGISVAETDYMQVFGTMYDDTFLLRASSSLDGLAFVALLNEGPNAERINYWNLERMLVTGSFGDDYFAVDDVRAETTITGDVGKDRFQVGQLYRSSRDAGSEFAQVESEDVFATIETTIGFLSDGINRPMTIYGGADNDSFTVFHNKAVLSLFGEDGDDTFLIKAFALVGSQEPFRDRTDVSGGAGADLVQYAVNAPVNIDGGDGFDTVIIIGTEFGDDFVITKNGVYGAGLSVNFVNIESLSVDGAEGDDRFYVQSTSEKFITQIFGGLGSDTFNMSGDIPPVISNDLRGHSGVIRHSIEQTGSNYDDTIVGGIAANVYDNDPGPVVVVSEADGVTAIMEGGATDSYTVLLSKMTTADVFVQIFAPVQTQDQRERNSKLFRIDSSSKVASTPDGTAITLKFTAADWDTPQTVTVSALDDADAQLDYNDDALEGDATGFINHVVTSDIGITASPLSITPVTLADGSKQTVLTVSGTPFASPDADDADGLQNLGGFLLLITDGPGAGQSLRIKSVDNDHQVTLWGEFRADYLPTSASTFKVTRDIEAVRAVAVTVHDDDAAGVIVLESGNSTDLFEGGSTDTVSIRLARQPVGDVTVNLGSNDGQLSYSEDGVLYSQNGVLHFNSSNWATAQTVTVKANDDSLVEGFHHALISFNVTSADHDTDVAATNSETLALPAAYVAVEHLPKNGQVTQVRVENLATHLLEVRDPSLYTVISNKVVFLTAEGDYDFLTGEVEVTYQWVKAGYNGLEAKPLLTNIADNETPQVLITESGGSTDVVENAPPHIGAPWTDSYDVVLTRQPDQDVFVRVTVDDTKTSSGRNIHFGKQVAVSSAAPEATNNVDGTVTLKFTSSNWNVRQVVSVLAVNDGEYDGDDTQYFAPALHTVSEIQGPIYLFGEGGNGSVVASDPLMFDYEVNILPPTDEVISVSGNGSSMTVAKEELLDAALVLNDKVLTVEDLVTQQMTITIAAGVEEVGQFRLITGAVDNGSTVTLTFDRAWDLAGGDIAEPFSAITKYAVSRMSPNFFAIEEEQIDYVFVYNEDSPADNVGARAGMLRDSTTVGFEGNSIVESFATRLDGKWLTGLGMGAEDLKIGPYVHPRGITYGDMEVVELNLGDGADEFTITDTHVRSDGYQTWTIVNTGRGDDVITANLDSDLQVLAAGAVSAPAPAGTTTLTTGVTLNTHPVAGADLSGFLVKITGGTGLGQKRVITANTDHTLTVAKPWDVALDSTSQFEIFGAPLYSGTATAATPETDATLADSGASFAATGDGLKGHRVEIVAGAGRGAMREIISNTATTLTVSSAWGANLDETTVYRIYGEQDGPIAVNTEEGDDYFYGSASSIPLVVFGGDGVDHIEGGYADDIIFGDRGRVEYVDEDGKIVTLLGLLREKLDPQYLDAFTGNTLTDNDSAFPVKNIDQQGLEGFMLSIPDGKGFGQRALITSNDDSTLTVTPAWEQDLKVVPVGYDPLTDFDPINPQNNPSKYRISLIPENQTDGVTRDPKLIIAIDPEIGAADTIIGNAGNDRIFGGAGGDTVNGNSGDDIIFGDHGRLDYTPAAVGGDDGPRRGDFVPATLNRVRTIFDSIGGGDTIYGDEGNDIVLGGYNPQNAVDTLFGNIGNDFLIGDNGVLTFQPNALTPGNPRDVQLLAAQTLAETSGGVDVISGNAGFDVVLGGPAADIIYGDDATGSAGTADDQDLLFADNVSIVFSPGGSGPFSVFGSLLHEFETIDTIGTDDLLVGNDDPDLLIGGLGNDTISGKGGADILIGDAAKVTYAEDGITIIRIETTDRDNAANGIDTIYGGDQDDILIGGSNSDNLDGGASNDLIFGDNVLLVRNPGSGDAIDPRFRKQVGSGPIYDANGLVLVDSVHRARPGGNPAWADWTITLDQTLEANHFGGDYIAGGAQDDEIFGQLGNDTIQGDGSIDGKTDDNSLTNPVSAGRVGGLLQVVASFESINDGDDYIEGNGGADIIFGGLGQDDIIGGNSSLFSLTDRLLRPDGCDLIFGGAGTELLRNEAGNTVDRGDTQHGLDADMILGDNGNIYRLVSVGSDGATAYLGFTYDDAYQGIVDEKPIVVRAAVLLDYTPGGVLGAAPASDIGAADEVHGESGDDFIYGMKGDDAIFGEGQDDDIVGGYGNDWISGGTGDDGVIGDDGRILTSRNGQTELLNGVTVTVQPATVATGGNMQQANINVASQLKKSVNLTPFSTQPGWTPATDEFGGLTQKNSDDIIFGGWGNDWLHGGSGDDAISGAEALAVSFGQAFDVQGNPVGAPVQIDYNHPINPGNSLAFNPNDVNAAHANRKRAGEFALYDEYNPLTRILLAGGEFFLNFNATEGPLATLDATNKKTDGDDKIFGDLGNDWLVGGSGRDDLYGGFGNDLLNADDDLSTHSGLNDQPDVNGGSYEDRAFGGAGRDVLIANTGGDRLIDWSGEFNSYLVPFSPFGMATVSRSLQPALTDFLYALSRSDGADATRVADIPGSDAARNGEPWGELGLVLQKDAAWNDQHGGPADPQPGNSNGQRDVLRSANFNTGAAQGFTPQIGTFSVVNNRYQVAPSTSGGDAISLFNASDSVIPNYFELQATINAVKPTGGNKANAYLIFDWQSNTDFKFAGIDVSTNKIEIGHRDASGWNIDTWTVAQLKGSTDYIVMLKINGSAVTMVLGTTSLSYTFAPRIDKMGVKHGINDGVAGIGAMGGTTAQIDDLVLQAPPGVITLDKTVDFGSASPAGALFNLSSQVKGNWSTTTDGRFIGTAASTTAPAVNLIGYPVTPGALVELTTKLKTSGQGGVVFDYQGPEYYKFVTLSADSKQLIIGHRTSAGTMIDRTFNMAVSSGTDYNLGVTLRGSLVNASINGAVVASFVYNETVTVGGYGLISAKGTTSGQTSFDMVRLRTDEASYGLPRAALVTNTAPVPASPSVDHALTPTEITAAVTEATRRWSGTGLDAAALATLGQVSVEVVNLDGLTLGEELGNAVYIDIDAAGSGWFVDASPADNAEFSIHIDPHAIAAAAGSVAYGKMDLVTVVMHEIGHVLGYEHADAARYAVMHEDLDLGVRYLLDPRELNVGTTAQTADHTLLRLAVQAAGNDAFSRMGKTADNIPSFDLDSAGNTGASSGINWNDRFLGGWGANPSPFGNGAVRSAPNFSDFLAKVLGSRGDDSDDDRDGSKFDKMGGALNAGNATRTGKGAGR